RETTLRFAFEVRGLRFGADQLRFYIKPEDGLELPAIMQWLKQTFAQRYNALTGADGAYLGGSVLVGDTGGGGSGGCGGGGGAWGRG
ncbi:MAG: hypothetical protein LBG14_04710, partial [Treponema sp.]|nr:hypothetical protein [Treponema sp.]